MKKELSIQEDLVKLLGSVKKKMQVGVWTSNLADVSDEIKVYLYDYMSKHSLKITITKLDENNTLFQLRSKGKKDFLANTTTDKVKFNSAHHRETDELNLWCAIKFCLSQSFNVDPAIEYDIKTFHKIVNDIRDLALSYVDLEYSEDLLA